MLYRCSSVHRARLSYLRWGMTSAASSHAAFSGGWRRTRQPRRRRRRASTQPTAATNAFVVNLASPPPLPPSLLLLFSFLLLLRVSLLFHPCIGFGLHLVLAAAALRRSRHMTPRRRDRELQQMRDEWSFGSALPYWS